jgi:hypothetical protein
MSEKTGDRIEGLGDVVAAATKALGIKPCGGCQKRRERLNRAFPFRRPPILEKAAQKPLRETDG